MTRQTEPGTQWRDNLIPINWTRTIVATSLSDLIAQKVALECQIRDAQPSVKSVAIAQVRKLMTAHGLTATDLVAPVKAKQSAREGTKVAPKYRDPATGSTWTGRGVKPKCLAAALEAGKSINDFVI